VGQTITLEVLCDGASFLARGLDRMRLPAWGVGGGRPGRKLQAIFNRFRRMSGGWARSTNCMCGAAIR